LFGRQVVATQLLKTQVRVNQNEAFISNVSVASVKVPGAKVVAVATDMRNKVERHGQQGWGNKVGTATAPTNHGNPTPTCPNPNTPTQMA
jgi:hypothetical protein